MDVNFLHKNHALAMMEDSEKIFLHQIVKELEPNSVIVEVGTARGGSCSIMAHANDQCNIYTIDLFGPVKEFSKVKTLLAEFERVEVLKGNSFEDFKSWDKEIDLYFEDGAHEDPALTFNVDQWLKYVKINGIVLFHDCNEYFPDVEKKINELMSTKNFLLINKVNSLVALKRVR